MLKRSQKSLKQFFVNVNTVYSTVDFVSSFFTFQVGFGPSDPDSKKLNGNFNMGSVICHTVLT